MSHSDTDMASLVEALHAAERELQTVRSTGLLDSRRPLIHVLKVELLGHIQEAATHIRQLRWLLREMSEKQSEEELAETLRQLRERATATFLEQVDAIVSARLDR
jgi:hypothetical protein